MSILYISLGVLVGLSLFSVIMGGGWGGNNLNLMGESTAFSIDPLEGAIPIIITVMLVAGLVGINIMGSGLGDTSVRWIMAGLSYGGIWLIFSGMCFGLFVEIPIFGLIIYIGLTVMYLIGVIEKMVVGIDV